MSLSVPPCCRPGGQELLVALAYAALGLASLQIAIPPDYVCLVFLPAGLAVAAVQLRGMRALWGVFAGALAVQWMAHAQIGIDAWRWSMLVPSVGATLQAGITVAALRRWLDEGQALDTPASVLRGLLVVVPLGSAVNALVSVPLLAAGGIIPWPELIYSLWTWWIGDAIGVVLLLPVLLALYGRPVEVWRPRVRTVALPMLVAMVVVAASVALVRSTQEAALTARFAHDSEEIAQRLQRRLDAMTDAVDAISRAVALTDALDAAAFRQVTGHWLTRYRGIQDFAWSPLVTHAQRPAYEQALSAAHGQALIVRGRDVAGRTFPASPAPQYLPITLIEPPLGNQVARGLDILVLPTTAGTARRAIETGRVSVSEGMRLVQETARQRGVVVYQPVFSRTPAPALRGIVSAALRLDDLLLAVAGEGPEPHLRMVMCLMEPGPGAGLQPPALAGATACAQAAATTRAGLHLSHLAQVSIGERHWTLRLEPGPGYLQASRDWTAWAVTAIGLAAVGLLGCFLLVITGHSRRTQRLVEQRTHELAQSNASLTQLAHHDPLTGLYNRNRWTVLAQQILDDARRHGDALAVAFIDLDRFKHINDSLGHSQGDLLLARLAERMTGCLRGRDVLARLGGDEFVVLLPRLRERHGAQRAVDKLMQALTQPVSLLGHDATVTASIGVAVFPDDGESIETLLRHADIAMYAAKDSGRNAVRFFSPDMHERLSEHLLLERELRRALAHGLGELRLEYQPQIDLRDQTVVGAEALLRWQHPALGAVRPDRFIPVAEQCGLIESIDLWVLRQACAQLRRWQDAGLPLLRVAVNISAQDFSRANFLPQLERILVEAGALASWLELEITESLLMQGAAELRERLLALTRMGPTLALDDFGTGYSNLGYLKRLPLGKLKIDRSFVVDVPGQAEGEALVRAIVSMAHDLGLKVLAEGVETPEQQSFLRQLGCDLMQGWLVSRALAPEALVQWLAERAAAPATAVTARTPPVALPA